MVKKFTQLRNTSRHNLIDLIPLNKPFTITIDICSLCNFKCEQCIQNSKSENLFNKRVMTLEEFKKIVDDLKKWDGEKIKVIKLYNCGEPLLNPKFGEILKYLHDSNVTERIDLTSNCSLLTEEFSKYMVEYELDYLRVSIYSPIQEINNNITNTTIDVEKIYNNLLQLKKVKAERNSKKPFVAIKMFETDNEEEKQLFLNKYSNVADELFFEKLHNFSGSVDINSVKKVNKKCKEICPWPFYSLNIQSNGDVTCCCVDWLNQTKVGNVFEEKIEEIWNGKNLYNFRIMQIEKKRFENECCKNCNVFLSDDFTVDDIDDLKKEDFIAKCNNK